MTKWNQGVTRVRPVAQWIEITKVNGGAVTSEPQCALDPGKGGKRRKAGE